jgi:hypothetical protein
MFSSSLALPRTCACPGRSRAVDLKAAVLLLLALGDFSFASW